MPRLPLISERTPDLSAEQLAVYDHVTGSRGRMIRPYEVLLHAPGVARPMSELGAQIRYHTSLPEHDRELAIMTVAAATGCRFEWESHHAIAREAGVRPEVLDHLENASTCDLAPAEVVVIDFVRGLHESASVAQPTFAAAHTELGDRGVVELAALVGYYTMLAYVMGACDVC